MQRLRWLFLILNLLSTAALAQSDVPVVTSGAIPTYPSLALLAKLQGTIELTVVTDGSGVESVTAQNGPEMLAKAAENNIKSWKFVSHPPTTFTTKFSYLLTTIESCGKKHDNNGKVILKLPNEVEIDNTIYSDAYCDPDAGLDLSEPLKVFLTSCDVDGTAVPCDTFKIQLNSGTRMVLPSWFKNADRKQGFIVPKKFRSLKDFMVTVDTGHGIFSADSNIALLKGNWRVGIDHRPFKENTPVYNVPKNVRCVGFIHFEWSEPERVAFSKCYK